jgi:Holliday junction resolvasome RuvABC DNA-binding subunit
MIGAGMATIHNTKLAQESAEVLVVLTALGYSVAEANQVVATMPPVTDLSLEKKIKLALQYLGG